MDVIEDESTFLIVMDYIQGNPLSRALEEYGAQPQEHVIEWAKQLCDVLGYLHTRTPAIIYRDMKPANVMLKPDGNVTLIDFGTAREFKKKPRRYHLSGNCGVCCTGAVRRNGTDGCKDGHLLSGRYAVSSGDRDESL